MCGCHRVGQHGGVLVRPQVLEKLPDAALNRLPGLGWAQAALEHVLRDCDLVVPQLPASRPEGVCRLVQAVAVVPVTAAHLVVHVQVLLDLVDRHLTDHALPGTVELQPPALECPPTYYLRRAETGHLFGAERGLHPQVVRAPSRAKS